jgi:glycosyltransferase involved in cell wall biosynthesis
MKIGILGTRGIPNNYGGFEQFAEFFSIHAAQVGHSVSVYTPHNHSYKETTFEKVNLIKCYDPEYKIGTAGQFIYDLNCILDARKRNFDIILQLGYTSSAFWYDLHPKHSIVITNMDGLEWRRSKYNKPTQKLLKIAEKWAATKSDYLISDSIGVQEYLLKTHNKQSEYIAYGANNFDAPDENILNIFQVEKHHFSMIMARFEPENNLEMVLQGVAASENKQPILVIGNHETKYGENLKSKFSTCKKIQFLGPMYNQNHLDNLRYFSNLYFHGHSVGGTNPSLLEAMGSQALVIAHNNSFNKGVLQNNAYYFSTADEVKKISDTIKKMDNLQMVQKNFELIENEFNWDKINGEYLQLFEECLSKSKTGI